MTLLTDTPAAATPAATPTPPVAPSSGAVDTKVGEQTATGKEPVVAAEPTAEPTGKAKDDNAGDKPKGAPEAFTFKPSPEGYEVGVETQTALSEVARELNLSNEAAQKIVDKVSPALRQQSLRNLNAMVDGWVAETKNDPVIGGEKLNETLGYAQRGMALGTPELRQLLGPISEGGTGLGNHKVIIAFMAAIGRKVSPDAKVVSGSEAGRPPLTAEERLAATYGS